MKNVDQLQVKLFKKLKFKRGETKNLLVNEITDLLNVSQDSAYRRIRGETPLTLSELAKINSYYDISVSEFFQSKKDAISFNYNWPTEGRFKYPLFLEELHQYFSHFTTAGTDDLLIFNAKDLPTFYFFMIPEISAFKGFFWERAFFRNGQLRFERFDPNRIDEKTIEIGYEILRMYNGIHSIEVWGDELLNSTLSQICFYTESEIMEKSAAKLLLDKMEQLVNHLHVQTESGIKHMLGHKIPKSDPNLKVYHNEVLIGDNSVLLKSNGQWTSFISKNVISSLICTDAAFCEHSWKLQENLINQSILLTQSAEKERNKYFNRLQKQIDSVRERLHI